jgi:NAD-specific glutamate dehydrogenase
MRAGPSSCHHQVDIALDGAPSRLLDYVAVKRFDARGDVCGEHRFLGLFTSTAYSAKPSDIPLLRRKTANVLRRAHLPPGGHAEKALINILDTYPRDELFQTSEDELLRIATGILHLGDRQRFRLFARRDPFERFVTCLIYAPARTIRPICGRNGRRFSPRRSTGRAPTSTCNCRNRRSRK